jgi:uncharacterized protein (DUF1697 family)
VSRYAALLRGINVGGKNTIAMADLRTMCEALGLDDVQTYIRSGNVVFTSALRSAPKMEAAIERAILADTGLTVTVMVRSASDIARVVKHNPYAVDDLPATKLVVAFLKSRPKAKTLDLSSHGRETAVIDGTVAYLHYPDGQGRSKVTGALLERLLGTPATVRNWNTVGKLLSLTATSGA